jgi:hypothetical protein
MGMGTGMYGVFLRVFSSYSSSSVKKEVKGFGE